jgi:hypothetical protein
MNHHKLLYSLLLSIYTFLILAIEFAIQKSYNNSPTAKGGMMVDSNHKMILASGRFKGTNRQQLTAAFDTFVNSPQKNTLVIHFHGGLVSESSAETIAESLLDDFQTAGGYPFFVIWQTWVTETLRNNWQEIIKEDAFSILFERTVQFLLGKPNQAPARGRMEAPPF